MANSNYHMVVNESNSSLDQLINLYLPNNDLSVDDLHKFNIPIEALYRLEDDLRNDISYQIIEDDNVQHDHQQDENFHKIDTVEGGFEGSGSSLHALQQVCPLKIKVSNNITNIKQNRSNLISLWSSFLGNILATNMEALYLLEEGSKSILDDMEPLGLANPSNVKSLVDEFFKYAKVYNVMSLSQSHLMQLVKDNKVDLSTLTEKYNTDLKGIEAITCDIDRLVGIPLSLFAGDFKSIEAITYYIDQLVRIRAYVKDESSSIEVAISLLKRQICDMENYLARKENDQSTLQTIETELRVLRWKLICLDLFT